jgi:nicotinamidase-related amidase
MAHLAKRARRETRRRPLAAVRHTQRFNIFTEHKIYIYIIAASNGGFLTTGFDGVADGLRTTQCFPTGIPSNTCRACTTRDCSDTLLQGLTTDCMEGLLGA